MNFRITTFFFIAPDPLWAPASWRHRGHGQSHLRRPRCAYQDRQGRIKSKASKHETVFENINDRWYLKDGTAERPRGIVGMIDQIKEAEDETACLKQLDDPISPSRCPARPEEPKEWKFYVGKENLVVHRLVGPGGRSLRSAAAMSRIS